MKPKCLAILLSWSLTVAYAAEIQSLDSAGSLVELQVLLRDRISQLLAMDAYDQERKPFSESFLRLSQACTNPSIPTAKLRGGLIEYMSTPEGREQLITFLRAGEGSAPIPIINRLNVGKMKLWGVYALYRGDTDPIIQLMIDPSTNIYMLGLLDQAVELAQEEVRHDIQDELTETRLALARLPIMIRSLRAMRLLLPDHAEAYRPGWHDFSDEVAVSAWLFESKEAAATFWTTYANMPGSVIQLLFLHAFKTGLKPREHDLDIFANFAKELSSLGGDPIPFFIEAFRYGGAETFTPLVRRYQQDGGSFNAAAIRQMLDHSPAVVDLLFQEGLIEPDSHQETLESWAWDTQQQIDRIRARITP